MIKILHFITDTNIGGAGNLLVEQIRGLGGERFNITVALPSGSALIEKLAHLPCKIVKLKHGADKSFSLCAIIEGCKVIKRIRPDIVHSHGSLSSRIAATVFRVPSRVFTRHCAPPVPKLMKNPLFKWLYGKINGLLSTSIIATAECAKQNLLELGCDGRKITTVVNGVSPLRRLSDGEKAFVCAKYGLGVENFIISIFARLESGKGHKTLLLAARICKKSHPNFRFFIVGEGKCEEELKEYSKLLGVDDTVRFVGFLSDIAPIFNITDLNVNCSYISETSSLSLSEGMSLGIPAVVSNIGGNVYMINNEENGLVFTAQNPCELAKTIIRMYDDKKLYKKCSIGAYTRYKNELNNKAMLQKMTDFYLSEYVGK